MNELSLFTGAGGGLLGTHLLGWRPIGYVEIDTYCQRVIAQRIADGILPAAPIFTDVREFVQSGAAAEYRGVADVVTGGFPCQPFSLAGKRLGADDPRNMWPATIATIREVRPRFAFLENVPGLVTSGYFGTILGDLAESGYDARWRILSAAEVGAPHKRSRLWIVAYATDNGAERWAGQPSEDTGITRRGRPVARGGIRSGRSPHVAHTERTQTDEQRRDCQRRRHALGWHAEAAQRNHRQADPNSVDGCGTHVADAARVRRQRTSDTTRQARWPGPESVSWWGVEPAVG